MTLAELTFPASSRVISTRSKNPPTQEPSIIRSKPRSIQTSTSLLGRVKASATAADLKQFDGCDLAILGDIHKFSEFIYTTQIEVDESELEGYLKDGWELTN